MLTGWRLTVSKLFLIPQRWVVGIMSFNALLMGYILRVCISLTITEMVIPKNTTKINPNACPVDVEDEEARGKRLHTDKDKLYDWDETTQGSILGAFYFGYLISHLPGGILSEKIGAKIVVNSGMFVCGLLTLFTPWILVTTNGNFPIYYAVRVLQGITQGPFYPAVNYLLATWVPLEERGLIGSVAFSGALVGTIISNYFSGKIIEWTNEWANVFYIYAIMTFVFCISWQLLLYSTPEQHPFIKDEELEYIKTGLGAMVQSRKPPIPWKKILTNVPVWSLISAQFGHDWGYFTMVTDLPKYFKDVLKFKISDIAFWSSITFVFMTISSIVCGWGEFWLEKKQVLSITTIRKLGATISSFVPSAFMLGASYSGCNQLMASIMFVLAMTSMGPYYSTLKVNVMDLTPNYSGTLMAIVNGLGSIAGALCPLVLGMLTENNSIEEWRLVFWIVFIIFNVTNLTLVIWGTAELQDFNNPEN